MATKKSKYSADDLIDFSMEETEIRCTKCGDGTNIQGDAYYSSEYFFKDGWRATPNHCYCPKCAKKYLKSV